MPASLYLIRTLKWLRKHDFRPVPLHPRSKAAILKEYVQLDYEPPADDLWARGDYGLGVVTGPMRHGPVDCDLDCEAAIFFAARFFPPTDAVFGRPSKPNSHYLYKVNAEQFEKCTFIDPITLEVLLELRGDGGHQTVMPGSVHSDSGETVVWRDNIEPSILTVEPSVVTWAGRKTGVACLVARHLWNEGTRNEVCLLVSGTLCHLEWPLEETLSLIQAVMDFCGDDDRSRLSTVHLTYRRFQNDKKVAGAGKLTKFVERSKLKPALVGKLCEWAGSTSANILQEYNERYAVVDFEGKFRIVCTDVPGGELPSIYTKDDFLNLTWTDRSDAIGEDGKPVSKGRYWLSHPQRRQYRAIEFLPGFDSDYILNLWNGWAVTPNPEASCAGWLELLREVICGGDEELYRWMLHWFANILREPMKKSLTAPVIIGPEGAGKSLLLAFFGRILGMYYTVVTNEEHIYGRFNKHMAMTLLLHSEEALYGGEKRHAGIIRSLITDEFRMFEQKGVDAKRIRNFMRLVLTSNNLHAAPAKPGDRRFTTILMGLRKASNELIQKVLYEMEHDGPAALMHYLLTMDYDPQIPRTNIKNEALLQQKLATTNSVEAWWHDTLVSGQLLPNEIAWAQRPAKELWPKIVSAQALYASYYHYCDTKNMRAFISPNLVKQQFKTMIRSDQKSHRRYFSDSMEFENNQLPKHLRGLTELCYAYHVPTLAECRKAFEEYIGQPIDWGSEEIAAYEPEGEDDGPKF